MGNPCQIKKKLEILGMNPSEATSSAWRIYNLVNQDEKRSKEEELELYKKIVGQLKEGQNMSWEECLSVGKKSGVSDPEAFCGWMKQQGKVT